MLNYYHHRLRKDALNVIFIHNLQSIRQCCKSFSCPIVEPNVAFPFKGYKIMIVCADQNLPHVQTPIHLSFYNLSNHSVYEAAYNTVQTAYSFDKYKQNRRNHIAISMYHENKLLANTIIDELTTLKMVRDIENEPANIMTPLTFASFVENALKPFHNTSCTIYNARQLEQMHMNLLLAVGQGSKAANAPCFITIKYSGATASTPYVALVGKGITFDSGGYSMKAAANMIGMHTDKSGAAIAFGVLYHMAKNKIPINMIVLLPMAENMVSSTSTRPHDIVRSYSGKYVEITDTDAEGRLVMADALAYLKTYSALQFHIVIDIATLTGSIEKIHPQLHAGFYTLNTKFAKRFTQLGDALNEKVWQLPKWKMQIESHVADLQNYSFDNSWKNYDSYMASQFLMEFVPKRLKSKWLHIDIAKNFECGIANGNMFKLLLRYLYTSFVRR